MPLSTEQRYRNALAFHILQHVLRLGRRATYPKADYMLGVAARVENGQPLDDEARRVCWDWTVLARSDAFGSAYLSEEAFAIEETVLLGPPAEKRQ